MLNDLYNALTFIFQLYFHAQSGTFQFSCYHRSCILLLLRIYIRGSLLIKKFPGSFENQFYNSLILERAVCEQTGNQQKSTEKYDCPNIANSSQMSFTQFLCVSFRFVSDFVHLSNSREKVKKVSKHDRENSENADDAATKPLWLYMKSTVSHLDG